MASPASLWSLLNDYVDFGWHRTGSLVDQRTARWLSKLLAAEGFDTEIRRVDLPIWQGDGQVTVNGMPIEHVAVPGEWSGRVSSRNVLAMGLDVHSGGFAAVLDEPIRRAREQGADAVVVATRHPRGSLVGVNRPYEAEPSGMPVFLVAGWMEPILDGADIVVDYVSSIEPGATWNVVARRPGRRPTVMITTPLNGWFECAGERGTGLVVLIDVLRRLPDADLEVVLTGGHELGFHGAEKFFAALPADHGYRGVFHIGASVAVESMNDDGTASLIGTRTAMCSETPDRAASVIDALRAADLNTACSVQNWIGEGTVWGRMGCPLVSITGAGEDFHTPGDVPEAVTSPEALARVGHAFARAVAAFLEMVDDGTR